MDEFYIPDEIWKHILEYALPQTTLGDVTVSNVILPDEEGNHTYRDKIKKFSPSPISKYGFVGSQYYLKKAHFIMFKKYLEICLTKFDNHIHLIERKRKQKIQILLVIY